MSLVKSIWKQKVNVYFNKDFINIFREKIKAKDVSFIKLQHLLDINDWVQSAMTGKINNCLKRMQREWTDKLMNDESFTDSIPSNKADFVKLITSPTCADPDAPKADPLPVTTPVL